MREGDYISTPRFLTVRIERIYKSEENARKDGFTEPTHFRDSEYGVVGKMIGVNLMEFAAYKKEEM